MILLLDTTRYGEVRVALYGRSLKLLKKKFDGPVRGQLLNVIDELIRREHARVSDLTGIIVSTGPGPFSALRSAAAVANALAYALLIPAVGVAGALTMPQLLKLGQAKLQRTKSGAFVVPTYGRPPNISKAKKR